MVSPDIGIRSFRPNDQATARQLLLAGLGEHFGYVDETCNPDIDDIVAHYTARGHVFLIAEMATEVVGTGALIIGGPDTGRIVRVSVARGHRRRGIGRALVAQLAEAAREHGLTRLWAETNDDWRDAISLYRSCGFREYERSGGSVYLDLDLFRPMFGQPTILGQYWPLLLILLGVILLLQAFFRMRK